MDSERLSELGERFASKVRVNPVTGCWEWTSSVSGRYGRFSVRNRHVQAHRHAYELLVGPIPDGHVLDHLCWNGKCVNPSHVEPVTQRENVLRGLSPAAQGARREHCVKGHPLSEAKVDEAGRRICMECRRERNRAYKARRKERDRAA